MTQEAKLTQIKFKQPKNPVLRIALALVLLTLLITLTAQETTQADEPIAPSVLDCPDRMTAYWWLDEAAGPDYADSLDGRDASCNTLPCPTAIEGKVKGAQRFGVATDSVTVAADAAFDWDLTDAFSIEFWMRTDASSTCAGNQVVLGRDAAPAESALHWWIGCTGDSVANLTLRDTDGNIQAVGGVTDVTDGNWHHVAAWWSGGDEQRFRLYVDGVWEDSSGPTSFTGSFTSPTAPLTVGWIDFSPSQHYQFVGDIDELAVYSRALSDAEIAEHYTSGRSYCLDASINLTKTASETDVQEGDTVVYTYEVTNDGNEDLSSVNLEDDTCAPISGPTGDTGIIGQLAIGEAWTYTCSQVLYSTTTNTATVTGISEAGVQVSDTDTETVTVTPVNPAVTITKQADKDIVASGDTVVYSYEVENTGDVELTQVTVTDDQCSPVTGPQGSTFAVGETASFSCSQVLTQETTNTGSVTANHQGISGTVSDDSDLVTVQVAGISLDKSASSTSIEFGETVLYTYQVRNTGDVPLTDVVVADDKCSPVLGAQGSTLNPGDSMLLTCSQTLNETTTNTGTVTGTYQGGGTVTATDSATVRIDIYYSYLPVAFNP
jgi:hypothetical protein